MNLRSMLLAGTVLPLALTLPAVAQNLSPGHAVGTMILAQAEEACPEGQECPPPEAAPEQPPAEQQAQPEAPPAEPPAEQQAQPEQPPAEAPAQQAAPEQLPDEQQQQAEPEQPGKQKAIERARRRKQELEQQAEPEQPTAEPPVEQQAQPEQPPAEAPAQQATPEQLPEEQPAQQQAEPAQPAPQDAIERARRRKQELQQQGGEQPPAGTEQQPATAETPPPQPPAQAETVPAPAQPAEPAAQAEESVVEEQLEAQGDKEEAGRVRTLRKRLFEQFQAAEDKQPENEQAAPGGQQAQPEETTAGRERRRRDRNQGDGNFGGWDPWWEREGDRDHAVERRDNRIIIDLGGGNIYVEAVVPDEGGRLLYGARDVEVQNLPGGRTRTIVYRENGVQIITVRDRYGNILSRSKRYPNNREVVLFDNRFPEDYAGGPPPILIDVPPPVINIPPERYVVDLGRASQQDIRQALLAPPVQQIERPYTLQEVLHNEEVRAYSPRIDLDTITFEFGSSTISSDQMQSLMQLGQAMEQVLADNPDEVYLVEGHTDAVGSDYDNLILSDKRAEAVAVALSQNFEIPPENLVTEGYGEQYLKVNTEGPERRNRRATVRRLTELLAQN